MCFWHVLDSSPSHFQVPTGSGTAIRGDHRRMMVIRTIKTSLTTGSSLTRQVIHLVALACVLWLAEASAHTIPANCPANLATADIIDHDFTVSFCELCDIGTIVPAGEQFVIEITVVLEDTPTNTPSTQFVNTAKWDFGTYEIATP